MTTINKASIIHTLKIAGLASLFVAGFISHDPVTSTASRVYEFVFPAHIQTYTAKLTEYDQRTKDLYTSSAFQLTCEHSARSIVALELAQDKKNEALNFLKEYEKHETLAQFERPASTAIASRATSTTIHTATVKDVIR